MIYTLQSLNTDEHVNPYEHMQKIHVHSPNELRFYSRLKVMIQFLIDAGVSKIKWIYAFWQNKSLILNIVQFLAKQTFLWKQLLWKVNICDIFFYFAKYFS